MTILASIAVSLAGRGPARRFDAAARDPVEAQRRKLIEIMQRNRDTEYGRKHGFGSVASLAEFAAAAPITVYEDIAADMERVARGAKNVFTAEDPMMFARTSGTTGKAKLIPVTKTCQGRDHRDQMRTWLWHAQREHRGMMRGQVMSLVSPAVEGHTEAGIPYGSTSGHIYKNFPRIIRSSYVVPYPVFDIEDYDAKYYVLMRMGLAADVTFLCTANPSSILRLCEVANEQVEPLLRDIADGTLQADLEVPAEIRAAVTAGLRPRPELARRLDEAHGKRDGRLMPIDYWPNLRLIACWKGGTVASYLDSLSDWFAAEGRESPPVRDWGYLSSEARGSIPLRDDGSGGVLTIATNVYEFVAAEEVDAAPEDRQRWRCLGVGELEEGKDYYILITTTGGLYRYHIDDVVAVVGRHHEAPLIEFKRKGRDVTSITGEKVSANQVIMAVAAAAKESGVRVDHFKAEADVKAANYLFKVESAAGIPEGKRTAFLDTLDGALSKLNVEYAGKRKSQRLNAPVLQLMKPGWYARGMRAQTKQGKRQFQWKATVLELRPEPEADDRAGERPLAEVGVAPARDQDP